MERHVERQTKRQTQRKTKAPYVELGVMLQLVRGSVRAVSDGAFL